MRVEVFAFEPAGCEGHLVRVEVDIRRGIPAVDIVGLAAAAVRESRERVRASIRNSAIEFPQDRVLISLSPADLPKEGSSYDLPIAMRLLLSSGKLPDCGEAVLALGELTLDGWIHPVRGVLPALLCASRHGIRRFVIPEGNIAEARRHGLKGCYAARRLTDLAGIALLLRDGARVPGADQAEQASAKVPESPPPLPDFSDYCCDESLLRALVVAAAGRHNLLLFGPPGCGKTMAATRIPSLVPELPESKALEVASVWSLYGIPGTERPDGRRSPFRSPHHSASVEGMIGGGHPMKPGEISLAHNGMLFLDETPEFRRDVLQALREPLERGRVSVARAGRFHEYPADFQLLLAANPCPCGNLGNPAKSCVCAPVEIQRYWKKLGGPLLDRIDMRIPVTGPKARDVLAPRRPDQDILRANVRDCVARQMERTAGIGGVFNSRLGPDLVHRLCVLDAPARKVFSDMVDEYGLSARACHSVFKVGLTIADLAGSDIIDEGMIAEALSYRRFGEGDCYWPI